MSLQYLTIYLSHAITKILILRQKILRSGIQPFLQPIKEFSTAAGLHYCMITWHVFSRVPTNLQIICIYVMYTRHINPKAGHGTTKNDTHPSTDMPFFLHYPLLKRV